MLSQNLELLCRIIVSFSDHLRQTFIVQTLDQFSECICLLHCGGGFFTVCRCHDIVQFLGAQVAQKLPRKVCTRSHPNQTQAFSLAHNLLGFQVSPYSHRECMHHTCSLLSYCTRIYKDHSTGRSLRLQINFTFLG